MTKKETTCSAITLLTLFLIIAMSVYSCSVVFIKGQDNTVVDPDNYRIRHDRNLHINEKDTVNNIKTDTIWK